MRAGFRANPIVRHKQKDQRKTMRHNENIEQYQISYSTV